MIEDCPDCVDAQADLSFRWMHKKELKEYRTLSQINAFQNRCCHLENQVPAFFCNRKAPRGHK